jgi:hypothetical protein
VVSRADDGRCSGTTCGDGGALEEALERGSVVTTPWTR